jgi:tRNA pseudouridine38-40 synthase
LARFKLYIEYEGTRYSGWQIQKNARTVQGKLLEAAEKIFKNEKLDIQGSGRTDAGVHALCQVAHLEVKAVLAPEIIRIKMNDELPSDINILEVEKTHSPFHARHDALRRSYLYQISKRRTAFGKNYVWWIKDKLDFAIMQSASKLFIGMHNYVSFTDEDQEDKSTKVLVEDIQMKEDDELILIRVVGSHFLWKMVRRMVGVLVEIGRGRLSEQDLKQYLNSRSNEPAKYTAPPSGLFLEQIIYKGESLNPELKPMVFSTKVLKRKESVK